MPGTFITFEGIDGSGKSTQLRLLGNFLRTNGCDALLTREPGGTALGLRLRAALLDAMEEVDPLTELLVFAADRAQHVRRMLRPALEAGRVVISDRYADATVAYQGAGRGFSPELISQIVELATEGLKPDLTLLFDLSIDESTNRTARRTTGKNAGKIALDRLDIENAEANLAEQAKSGNYDNNKNDITEMDALVAYLQVLGTMVDFKQFDDDYFAKFR